jgi:hypothetical protein
LKALCEEVGLCFCIFSLTVNVIIVVTITTEIVGFQPFNVVFSDVAPLLLLVTIINLFCDNFTTDAAAVDVVLGVV